MIASVRRLVKYIIPKICPAGGITACKAGNIRDVKESRPDRTPERPAHPDTDANKRSSPPYLYRRHCVQRPKLLAARAYRAVASSRQPLSISSPDLSIRRRTRARSAPSGCQSASTVAAPRNSIAIRRGGPCRRGGRPEPQEAPRQVRCAGLFLGDAPIGHRSAVRRSCIFRSSATGNRRSTPP